MPDWYTVDVWATDLLFICGYNVECNVFIYCLHLCCSTFDSKVRVLIFRVYAEVKIITILVMWVSPTWLCCFCFIHPTKPIIED